MSKEQTPIEWLRSELWKYQILEKEDLELFDKAFEKEKEFTQAKVLEALESREHIDCGKDGVKTICPACRNVLWTTKQK
jgi:hypothetical protein